MTWFKRDHTGRPLSDYERDFIAALGGLLAEAAAPQLDANETVLTAEGTGCLIALIPHRGLGGVSLVLWLFPDAVQIIWAQVWALHCCHDSLDLGVPVARIRFDRRNADFSSVLECVRELIDAPITVRCFDDDRATVLVSDNRGKLQKVGEVGQGLIGSRARRRAVPTKEVVIRLSDVTPPPVTEPSGAGEWFAPHH